MKTDTIPFSLSKKDFLCDKIAPTQSGSFKLSDSQQVNNNRKAAIFSYCFIAA